ncbi:seed lectin-like [Abrus precatorius]|uniref:Seed lectin-like n=1 Tax=Abrus precatorius TaxID=3816 RepID=A0A8B8M9Q2_ABRPR|nr:seed lectin-like [Abrus precatorius]
MAIFIQKLLATKIPISLLLTITIFSLFLFNKVKSDISFNFPAFGPEVVNVIGLSNEATVSNGAIQLTKKDQSGNPFQHSVGQAEWIKPIRIHDKSSGKVADFATEFSFVVNKNGKKDYGDGFAFFFVSQNFNFPDSKQSEGGFLGMFTPDTAFSSNNQQILLVEFDSFSNEWDPDPVTQFPHLGVNVNSIKSLVTVPWLRNFKPDDTVTNARIEYSSEAQKLTVTVTYPSSVPLTADTLFTHDVDLTAVLPEEVQIGFSAATGDLVETHDILSWSFTSNL